MMSILYKEYLEHRLFFLLMVLTGLGSLVIARWARVLDNGTGIVLLFLLEAPILTYVVAHQAVFREFQQGTLPFLAGLPLGRSRVWLAKALFAGLFAAALYLAFALLGTAFGLTLEPIRFDRLDLFVFRNAMALCGIPVLVVAVGLFTTLLLPEGGALLAIVFTATTALVGYATHALAGMNLLLLEVLVVVALLATSWYTFVTGNLFSAWRLALRAVLVLAACVAAGTLLWVGIDTLAEGAVRLEIPEQLRGSVTEDGRRFFGQVSATAALWDTIPADSYQRAVEIDLATGRGRPVARRTTAAGMPTRDGRGLFAYDPWVWPGVAARQDLLFLDLADGGRERRVDREAVPHFLLPDDTLLYTRFSTPGGHSLSEICRWSPARGTHPLTAFPTREFRGPWPVRLFSAMLLVAREGKTPSRLLSLADGALLPIPLPPGATLAAETSRFAVFGIHRSGRLWNTSAGTTWFALDASGTRRDLPGLPPQAELRGTLPDGRLLVRTESAERVAMGRPRTTTLSTYRVEDGASQTLAVFQDVTVVTHLAPDGGYVVCELVAENRAWTWLDLAALPPAGSANDRESGHAAPLSGSTVTPAKDLVGNRPAGGDQAATESRLPSGGQPTGAGQPGNPDQPATHRQLAPGGQLVPGGQAAPEPATTPVTTPPATALFPAPVTGEPAPALSPTPIRLPGDGFRTVICRPGHQALFYGKVGAAGELWEADLRQGSTRRRWALTF
ncbi:MAG: ABC transporter permease subunit [Candidatus Riflebacteria bacterium]|nr:ABC transporter permease subunit [Candidatus Riflebacteria bacterium]